MGEIKMSYGGDDYSVSKAFGGWLKERRCRKGLSIEYSAFMAEIPLSRLRSLENGTAKLKLTDYEIEGLAQTYGLHPRAVKMRSSTG